MPKKIKMSHKSNTNRQFDLHRTNSSQTRPLERVTEELEKKPPVFWTSLRVQPIGEQKK